jgi:hypothetical protein
MTRRRLMISGAAATVLPARAMPLSASEHDGHQHGEQAPA